MSGVTRLDRVTAARSRMPGTVHGGFHEAKGGRDLPLVFGCKRRPHVLHAHGRGEGVHLSLQHRHRGGVQPLHQLSYLRRRLKASREHKPRNAGIVRGPVGSEGTEDDIGPVCRRDDEASLFQMIEKVR